MAAAYSEQRTMAQIKYHYDVEKELANRLRTATKEQRRVLYHTVYDERTSRIPDHPLVTRTSSAEAQARAVIPQLRLLRRFVHPQTTFLEIGPGDGALVLALAKWARKVYATDVSRSLVNHHDWPENVLFCLSDGINIPIAENSIGVAYSNQVMEHLHPEDAHDQLRAIHAALAPGGIYICITPNRLSGPYDISRYFDEVATGFHLKEYTLTELTEILRLSGFSKEWLLITYKGYILSPRLPLFPFIWVEWILGRLPSRYRKRIAHLLTAVKLVAEK
jgi:SAM-dependent methyltransferase